jgi:hypothetical protein
MASCLIVSTGTLWYGAARIPKALANAGFEVALLAPKDSLAEKSRFVGRVGHLPDQANAAQWVFAFAAMVKAVAPRIVLPGDDMSFRLLEMVVNAPPPQMQPAMHAQLVGLIVESLGDPAHYATSVDRTLLAPAAAALGIDLPPFVVATDSDSALAFAAEHGYPVVAKRGHQAADDGVATCADEPALRRAFVDLVPSPADPLRPPGPSSLLVQKAVDGHSMSYPVAAWKGEILAGWASEMIVANPEAKGAWTVARRYRDPQAREAARKLVAACAMSGLSNFEFMLERETRRPLLIEVSRRIPPATHSGAKIGVDLCAALLAALDGRPPTTRADLDAGESGYNVHFPQEWLRDPHSEWLRKYPVDVPWDEPELFEALLALRHAR